MQEKDTKVYFGVKNLRSIDLPMTELRPITILVGRNHTGKSSLLRAFPLIKQSSKNQLNGPILWDGNLVDFGSFGNAVKQGNENEGIHFQFGLENFDFTISSRPNEFDSKKKRNQFKSKFTSLAEIDISVNGQNGKTVRSVSKLRLPSHNLNLHMISNNKDDSVKVSLNNEDLSDTFSEISFRFQNNQILSPLRPVIDDGNGVYFLDETEIRNTFIRSVMGVLESEIGKNIESVHIRREVYKILENLSLDDETLIKLTNAVEIPEIKKFYKNLSSDYPKVLKKLNQICGLNSALLIYDQICLYFGNYYFHSLYFKPARTVNERYFKIHDSDESEISADGSNLSGFFESLNPDNLINFSNWMKENFNYGITFEKKDGRTSIFVEQDGIVTNLVDSGFGISEILPFITQIWWESVNPIPTPKVFAILKDKSIEEMHRSVNMRRLISIEQPELHLHPALQARLADILVKTIQGPESTDSSSENTESCKPMFLIETHCESLLNRLGELVKKQQVDHNDIQILIFSKTKNGDDVSTKIQEVNFDEEGHLQDWPHGFFRYSTGL